MLSSVTTARAGVDYLLGGLAALVLVVLVGVGVYGISRGFLQSRSYLDANEWVALICGVIGAGCAFYLMLEFTDRLQGQAKFVICLFCGIFSVFAVAKGLPAAATEMTGRPEIVRFEITGFDWGGRRCSRGVVAKNPDFEDFTMCADHLPGTVAPEIGRSIEVRGMRSNWGIIREAIAVRL